MLDVVEDIKSQACQTDQMRYFDNILMYLMISINLQEENIFLWFF
jgi:hypothetical protein